jgi:hypothetical protein
MPTEQEVTMALLKKLPELAEKHGPEKAMAILEDVGKIGTLVSQFDKDDFCLAVNFLMDVAPPELLKQVKEALQ